MNSCWMCFAPTERWELHLSTAASITAYVSSTASQSAVNISLLRLRTNWLNQETREKQRDAPPTGLNHSPASSSSSSSPIRTTEEAGHRSHHASWTRLSDRPLPASGSASTPTLPHLAQQPTLGTGASSRLPMVTEAQCCWRYSAARGVTDRCSNEGRRLAVNSSTLSLNKCTLSRKTSGESSTSTDEPKDTRSNCSSCRKQNWWRCCGILVERNQSVKSWSTIPVTDLLNTNRDRFLILASQHFIQMQYFGGFELLVLHNQRDEVNSLSGCGMSREDRNHLSIKARWRTTRAFNYLWLGLGFGELS